MVNAFMQGGRMHTWPICVFRSLVIYAQAKEGKRREGKLQEPIGRVSWLHLSTITTYMESLLPPTWRLIHLHNASFSRFANLFFFFLFFSLSLFFSFLSLFPFTFRLSWFSLPISLSKSQEREIEREVEKRKGWETEKETKEKENRERKEIKEKGKKRKERKRKGKQKKVSCRLLYSVSFSMLCFFFSYFIFLPLLLLPSLWFPFPYREDERVVPYRFWSAIMFVLCFFKRLDPCQRWPFWATLW